MTLTLEEDIVQWAAERSAWQQMVLRKLAEGREFTQAEVDAIADDLIADESPQASSLTASDIPGAQVAGATIRLKAIQELRNVNRLLDDGRLTFASNGLTVIYGDNASGKSGYARLIKVVVGARHREEVHPNIFDDTSTHPQRAIVDFEINGTDSDITWPGDSDPELRRVHFYDEACGDDYLGGETELSYRPSVLIMLDGLIAVCDKVHAVLDEKLRDNSLASVAPPTVPSGTSATSFLAGLSATTTKAEIDAACVLAPDSPKQLADLAQEEVRLRATDPEKERTRIDAFAGKVRTVADGVRSIATGLSDVRIKQAEATLTKATELRAAAAIASATTFESEPVSGVGSDTWRALWEAARQFSAGEAYHEHDFPYTGPDARCVLCQQSLSAEASSRFSRFHSYMQDTTERKAQAAERELNTTIVAIRSLEPSSPKIAAAIVELTGGNADLAEAATAWLRSAAEVKDALLARLNGETTPPVAAPEEPPLKALEDLAASLTVAARSIDATQFTKALDDVVAKKIEIEGRKALADRRADIEAEIRRLSARNAIETARRATDTTTITKKCTTLTRSHVTSLVRDQFTRETDRLRLERVTLNDLGGQKGKLRHKPALLGARIPKPVSQVLSEGEQTALGLAGYFTEAHFDGSKSAMVLDDPVTSLDHVRRSHVATRLAQFSKDRQVVIFTHDITFVGDLSKAAGAEDVSLTERCVQRRGDGVPGLCVEQYPWKARDVSKRLQDLDQQLAVIKRERTGWGQDQYESAVADWAGKLSETWERMISVEIANQVFDYGTSEVRPKMFRLFARITDDDDREFQESYGRCSQWARRHDKSPATNYVPPEPTEMEQELAAVRDWFARVKKYRS